MNIYNFFNRGISGLILIKRVCPFAQNFVTEIKYIIQPGADEKQVGKTSQYSKGVTI